MHRLTTHLKMFAHRCKARNILGEYALKYSCSIVNAFHLDPAILSLCGA